MQPKTVTKRFVDRMVGPVAVYIVMSMGQFAMLLLFLYSPDGKGSTLPPYFVPMWTGIGGLMIAFGVFELAVLAYLTPRLKLVLP